MSDTDTLTRPDLDRDAATDDSSGTDSPDVAHYVRKDQIVTSAVEGKHLVALCGEVFPVTKDAKGKPVCQECKRVYDTLRAS